MKVLLEIDGLKDVIAETVEAALRSKQAELSYWPYYTLEETARLLQLKKETLLDKRNHYLNELEYSSQGKSFWFKKESVLHYIQERAIKNNYKGRVPDSVKQQSIAPTKHSQSRSKSNLRKLG
jgi:hypothetical protein